ncbi:AraC family transcriptional regulator [Nocardia caishijiensis]|uniref:AraC-like DNA-binding protein n=1 Tax=Nocardia caishijiensis TaxID=184756 RepID=A0ABQ6YGS2_9NOCA|nr:helix-turn-helix domain-containing protein [Nocardia caishijiensis]KAF0844990.1 AraC-like DNA-binding protein [Nocardia caishijiensis]
MQRDPRELGGAWRTSQRHTFTAPPAELAARVERFWAVTWHYEQPYCQLIVPLPHVHLTCRDGRAELHGPSSSHVFRELTGAGSVFGIAFRPGMFRPFLGAPVASLRDRTIDATTVFGPSVTSLTDVGSACRFLEARVPAPDPRAELAAGMVAGIAADPALTRVDEVAERFAITVRGMQRLFADYVGIGPKWVIRRYRLHEVTERLAAGREIDWATLAADLGYADQAHLSRDFRAVFGEPPTGYAQRYDGLGG